MGKCINLYNLYICCARHYKRLPDRETYVSYVLRKSGQKGRPLDVVPKCFDEMVDCCMAVFVAAIGERPFTDVGETWARYERVASRSGE